MSMLFAGSGVGKSAVALRIALGVNAPALVFSADTDRTTTAARAACALTGHSYSEVERAIREETERGALYLAEIEALEHLQFCFDSSPSIKDIDAEVQAFGMVFGEYPHLIVVDNLLNVFEDDAANEYAGYRVTLDELHQLAGETQAHVLVLHHATGEYDDGDKVPPKSGISGKVSQIPELIISMARPGGRQLAMAPVKNRNGRDDPTGNWRIWFDVDLEYMRFTNPIEVRPNVRVTDDDMAEHYARQGY